MSINEKKLLDVYQLINQFLDYLNQKDQHQLEEKFELSSAMYEEIIEELERNFDNNSYVLSLIPFSEIESVKVKSPNRPIFEIEDTDEDGEFIVECNIYNKSKITDLILQGYLEYEGGIFKFTLPLFRS
ncbi:hypothetical protein [Acinetobacter gyllenbergii]|uniref:hypothetical protein n=1 Tax=Acinetobacter gyllenbergii TaxID=134534 RepID=UPI0003BF7C57|nr:hypothetical protein [Acinetobacter gyllenbergii]ESK43099.1 hypothetical protein F987_01980 [Acinetobacter gyllenbergii NIPH 230]